MVLEDQDVLESPVLFQVKNAITEGPQYIYNPLRRQSGKRGVVIGCFDDHFMRPDPIHAVKHAFRLAVQSASNAQRRELVGNDSHGPSRAIALRRRAAIQVGTISLNLGRGLALIAVAKRAKSPLILIFSRTKSVGRLARSVEI